MTGGVTVALIVGGDDRDAGTQLVLSSDSVDVVRSCALGMLQDLAPASDSLSAARVGVLRELARIDRSTSQARG